MSYGLEVSCTSEPATGKEWVRPPDSGSRPFRSYLWSRGPRTQDGPPQDTVRPEGT